MKCLLLFLHINILFINTCNTPYYESIFLDKSRESAYILVKIKTGNSNKLLVIQNSEFSRIISQQFIINAKEYNKLMLSLPVVNNVIQFNKPLIITDKSVLADNCVTETMNAKKDGKLFLALNTHRIGKNTLINDIGDNRARNCVIRELIALNCIIKPDDESGALLVTKFTH